jgi:hypothetical protein
MEAELAAERAHMKAAERVKSIPGDWADRGFEPGAVLAVHERHAKSHREMAARHATWLKTLGHALISTEAAALLADPPHTKPSAFQGFAVEFMAQHKLAGGIRPEWLVCQTADPEATLRGQDNIGVHRLAKGLEAVVGRNALDGAWLIGAFQFDPAHWTPERAKAWLCEHQVEAPLIIATQEVPQMELKKLLVALGLPETATEPEAETRLAEWKAKIEAKPALVAADVAGLLGVPADADLAAIKAALEKRQEKPADASAERVIIATALGLAEPASADLKALLAHITGQAGKGESERAEAIVASGIADRRLPPAIRQQKAPNGQGTLYDWWVAQAKADAKGTEAIIASMPPIVAGALAGRQGGDADVELTPEELAVGKQLGLTPEAILKEKKRRLGK